MNVSRETTSGAAYNDLRNLARRQGRPFDELLSLHALEGFLARLASSDQRDRMVLKGGVLLAAFDLRRPTRDIDLHAEDLSRDVETLVNLVRNIANLTLEDGLAFDGSSASGVVIRDEDEYSGVRVSLTAKLASANVALHVDVNVGDPISPAPQEISLPRLLGAPVALRGYPMEMVHAEKIVTAVSRGTANTRWRDFGDVYSLSGLHAIEGDDLLKSLSAVASHRQVDLIPLSVTLEGYAAIAQTRYTTWRRKQQRDDLPEEFQIVLERVFAFSDPALAGSVSGMAWNPFTLSWD